MICDTSLKPWRWIANTRVSARCLRLPAYAMIHCALSLMLVLLVVGCGAADTTESSTSPLTPTPIVSSSKASAISSQIVVTTATSPTVAASAAASPETLVAALPDVTTVATALGVALSEREVRKDLSQAFEGADFTAIDAGVVGLYRGISQDNYAIIDVAHFRDVEAAMAFVNVIQPGQMSATSSRQNLDLSRIGDAAFAFVAPNPDDARLTIGVAYVRVAKVVSVIVVRSTNPDLEAGMRELARGVAESIE